MTKRNWMAVSLGLVLLVCLSMGALAEVKVAGIFSDHMVLQRDMPVPVWGWADAGESVTVTFAGKSGTAKAGDDGKWMVKLGALKASAEGRELKVNGIVFKDVLVGDVWLCSGQSNMEWPLTRALQSKEEIAAANFPLIRLVTTPRKASPTPIADLDLSWQLCSPATVGGFSGVGYFFGRKLHQEIEIPIGLINSSWGGTRVEPWTPPAGFRKVAELKEIANLVDGADPTSAAGKQANRKVIDDVKAWVPKAEEALEASQALPALPILPAPGRGHQDPTMIYNAKIYPLVPYAMRGAIWYQGESNGGEGESYFHKKRALIEGWREVFGLPELSFYFVQLADFRGANKEPAGGDGWAKLREAQRKVLSLPRTGMAVIIDIGNARDIHPQNKQDVGARLARWALAKDYGRDLVYSGPLYKSHKVKGNEIHISFDHVGGGLIVGKRKQGLAATEKDPEGKLRHFAIAGEDKKWVWAEARIEKDQVVVSSPEVEKPVAVRYAFAQNPEGANLYNAEGLPASPFRTDSW